MQYIMVSQRFRDPRFERTPDMAEMFEPMQKATEDFQKMGKDNYETRFALMAS